MATLENQENFFLYALEDTACMHRFICGPNRPWTMNVTQGAQAGGPLVRGVSFFGPSTIIAQRRENRDALQREEKSLQARRRFLCPG